MAQNILTPEEKKYLGKIARYLSSLGMRFGEINFEMERTTKKFHTIQMIFQPILIIIIPQKFQTDLSQY
jgi:hypothetical protein